MQQNHLNHLRRQPEPACIESLDQLRTVLYSWRIACVIQAAVKLRLFDHMKQASTSKEISKASGCSERGTVILLDALASIGLVGKSGGRYQNSRLSDEFLVSGSESMMVESIDHGEQVFRRWARLPDSAKAGSPSQEIFHCKTSDDPAATGVFIRAMHSGSRGWARHLLTHLDLTDVKTALDVGGGAGSYLIALKEFVPELQAVLVDRRLTLEVARNYLETAGMLDMVELRESDIFSPEEDFGGRFDLVILSSIMHMEGSQANLKLLKKIKRSMHEYSRLLINEFLLDESATYPQVSALFSVNMLANTERGKSYRIDELEAMLREAGFRKAHPLSEELKYDAWIAE